MSEADDEKSYEARLELQVNEVDLEVVQLEAVVESRAKTARAISWLAVSVVVGAALIAGALGHNSWVVPASVAAVFTLFTLVREGYLELD